MVKKKRVEAVVEEAANTEVPREETPIKVKPRPMTEAEIESRYQAHLEKIKQGGK